MTEDGGCSLLFFPRQHDIMEILKIQHPLKEFYSERSYSHPLRSTINILLRLPYHISVCPSAHLIFLVPASMYCPLNTSACMSLTAVEDLFSFVFGLKIHIQCNTNLQLLSLDTCIHLCNPALCEHIEHPCNPSSPQISSGSLPFSPHPTSPGAVTVLIFFHPQLVLSLLEFHINGII